jgi:hypothetical protein
VVDALIDKGHLKGLYEQRGNVVAADKARAQLEALGPSEWPTRPNSRDADR